MSGSITFTWLQLFAAIGLGSIVAALISMWSARAVAISNHRQSWIDALRDDLVNYLKEIDNLNFLVLKLLREGKEESLERQHEFESAARVAYRRVLMRLNMTETLHAELAGLLERLMYTRSSMGPDPTAMKAAIDASREVLKYEWAVTKYGVLTKPVLRVKQFWRKKDPAA